jgi:hypothetical protein
MVSPWKFLTRLMSQQRSRSQEHGSSDNVKADVLAIAGPTGAAADNGLNAAVPSVDEKTVPRYQRAMVSGEPDQSEKPESDVESAADIEGAKAVEPLDPDLSIHADTVAHHASKHLNIREDEAQKRGTPAGKAEKIEAVAPSSARVATIPNDAINLDNEIKRLREQLSRKLRLQNAQLKRMLERFER